MIGIINYFVGIKQGKSMAELGDLKHAGLVPLIIMVSTLSVIVNIYVGDLALSPFSLARWQCICIVVFLFILVSLLLDIFASLTDIKKFTDRVSGNIKISALWKKVFTNPLGGKRKWHN